MSLRREGETAYTTVSVSPRYVSLFLARHFELSAYFQTVAWTLNGWMTQPLSPLVLMAIFT
jgi:hypothetical protein